ncbi:MAG: hypothetical protein EXR99_01035 [Gemmataceae bacterium]|nr:hypothetical protein [Gemmataceae bacterium]
MANEIQCGNPSCRKMMPLSMALPDGRIQCPFCKKVFQLRPQARTKPGNSDLNPDREEKESFPLAVETKFSRKKKTLGISQTQFVFLALGVFFLAVSGAAVWIFGVPLLKEQLGNQKEHDPGTAPQNLETAWFSLQDPKGYAKDKKLAIQLKTQLAFTGPQQDILAFYYKDYKTVNPEPEEEMAELKTRLAFLLPQNLEWEKKGAHVQVGGIAFHELEIVGANEAGENWNGSCLSGIYQGIHFLFIRLANGRVREKVQPAWSEFTQGFLVRKESRKDWTPGPGKAVEIQAKDKSFTLYYLHAIWTPQEIGEGEAGLAARLLGKNPTETGGFANQRGTLQVFSGPAGKMEADWKSPEMKIFQAVQAEPSDERKLDGVDQDFPLPMAKGSPGILKFKRKTYSLVQPDVQQKIIDLIYCQGEKTTVVLLVEGPWKARDFWAQQTWIVARSLRLD